MSATMTANFSNTEIMILQTMWKLRALGGRGVTIDELVSRLSGLSRTETTDRLKDLEVRGFIRLSNRAGDARFALSALGAACVRQLQDGQLGDLTGVS